MFFYVILSYTFSMSRHISSQEKERLSKKAGILGIVINSCLCTIKLIIGYTTNSISIITDGFNNLSDIGNAILIFFGYRLASKPADRQHPFGHGRLEYMLSQAISIMIMVVGLSLLKVSLERFVHPQIVLRNKYALIILCLSLAVKLALAYYYNTMHKKTLLEPFKAQKVDSLADSAGIIVIIIGYICNPLTDLPIDSIIGIIVSILIVYGGFKIFLNMTSLLLGQTNDDELKTRIEQVLNNTPSIKGYHDLRLHSYGSIHIFGSCDIELDGNLTLIEAHTIMDSLEEEIYDKFNVQMTLHGDPVVNNEELNIYVSILRDALNSIDSNIGFHDFHYNELLKKYLVNIDLPINNKIKEDYIKEQIMKHFKDNNISINLDIKFLL